MVYVVEFAGCHRDKVKRALNWEDVEDWDHRGGKREPTKKRAQEEDQPREGGKQEIVQQMPTEVRSQGSSKKGRALRLLPLEAKKKIGEAWGHQPVS